MQRAHKIRMYPSEAQTSLLWQAVGAERFAYNWGLERWNSMWEAHKADHRNPKPSYVLLSRIWTQEKPEWASTVARCTINRALNNLSKAWDNFFKKRADRPVFKKKLPYQGKFYADNTKASLKGTRMRLPNIGWIRLAEPLRFEGKIMSYTVSGYGDQWHVSVQVETADRRFDAPDSTVGIDVGLKTAAVASDGTQLSLPSATLKKLKAKLRRAERALARSQKASKRYQKKLKRKQKVQIKLDNIRQDVVHKFTTTVCKNHATVVIEDLDIEGMKEKAPFRSFRRAFNDSVMALIHYQLSYKAVNLIRAPRFYPSTKLCSACGSIKDAMPPSIRTYECEHCGAVIDRDVNAARNLMKLGLVKPE